VIVVDIYSIGNAQNPLWDVVGNCPT